jgi:outer membrane immunogenic protein
MRQVQRIAFVLFTVLESLRFENCVASAADMPMKDPAYIAPFSWTGFYVGGNVGGGWSSGWNSAADPLPDPTFFNASPLSFSNKASGIIGGGQIGYNWQFTPNWLVGIETDFQGANLKAGSTIGPIPAFPNASVFHAGSSSFMNRELDWFGTVRGRFGLTFDRWLVYGTGGFAYGEVKYSADTNYPIASTAENPNFVLGFPVSFSDTRPGWTVGGGAEYALPGTYGNWTIRGEYLFVSLTGGDSVTSSGVPSQPPPTAYGYSWNKTDFQIARFGLNYKFDLGAPVTERH